MYYYNLIIGQKSDDNDLPSYCPSLFTLTTQEVKQRVERGVERWTGVQHSKGM